jgi:hypothetical protein
LGEGDFEGSEDLEGEGELKRAGDDAGWVGDGT